MSVIDILLCCMEYYDELILLRFTVLRNLVYVFNTTIAR